MGCRAWKCWRLVVALSLRTTSASKRCSRQQASKLVRESLVLSMLFHLQHLFARREYAASKFFSADLVPLIPLMYAASFACSSYWKTSVFNAKLNGSWFMLCYPLMLFFWTFAPRTYICTLTGFGNNAHFRSSCGNVSHAWWKTKLAARCESFWSVKQTHVPYHRLCIWHPAEFVQELHRVICCCLASTQGGVLLWDKTSTRSHFL